MPGPTIQWKTVDTEVVLSEIREPGRYRLASPAAVTGAPSLAMQAAGQNCTVRTYIGGVYRSDSLLTVPSTTPVAIRNAVGQPLTGQEMFDMVIEVGNLGFGSVLLTTDEPNGSPAAPFATTAELPLGGPYVGHKAYLSNSLVEHGLVEFYWTGVKYKLSPDQTIARFANADGSAILDQTATLLTPGTGVELWSSTQLIPDWMVLDGTEVMTLGTFIVNDPASTAVFHAGLRISDVADTGVIDGNNSLAGRAMAASAIASGSSQAFVAAQIDSGVFLGTPGGTASPGQARRPLCSVGAAATRKARLSLSPGATTNRIRFYSFTIKTGAY